MNIFLFSGHKLVREERLYVPSLLSVALILGTINALNTAERNALQSGQKLACTSSQHLGFFSCWRMISTFCFDWNMVKICYSSGSLEVP